jgi:thiol-disulfide isomerase/thioredoxin
MRRTWMIVMAAVGLLGIGALARAQEEPGMAPADETEQADAKTKVDAAAMMRRADEAMTKLKSLSFKAHAAGVGGLATRSPIVDATVRMVRGGDKGDFGWEFLARGTARKSDQTEGEPFATWYDGKTLRTMREKEKTVLESSWDNNDETMKVGAGWVMAWATRWPQLVSSPFSVEEGHIRCRYEGDALVEGTPCAVVYVDYSELSDPRLFDAWWYLAKSDSLPRRVAMHFIDTGEGDAYGIATLTDVEAGASVEAPALAMDVPAGFEVRKAKEPEGRRRRPAAAAAPEEQAGPQVGQPAPDWALKDPSGKEHRLSELKGKVVVMDFWATWCPPCRMAMPGIQKIHEKYEGKPVEVFGVNTFESGDPAKYMKDQKFTYGLLLKGDEVAQKYGVNGIPAIFVVGKDGKILMTQVGYSDELDAAIEGAIEEGLKK